MRARWVFGLASMLALSLAMVAPAGSAASGGSGTLKTLGQVLSWTGVDNDMTGQGVAPPTEQTCTSSTCDTYVLHIDMPAGSFPKGPKTPLPPGLSPLHAESSPTTLPGDGVLISIAWPTDFDQWNLYVDDMSTGQTVAQGFDVDSNSQSVLLHQPHNGDYRITVVPFLTNFKPEDRHYRGEVRAFLDPLQRLSGKAPVLPAIQTVAPSNFHIADVPPIPSNPTGWRFTPDGTFANSCYLDETVQFGSTKCLRFDNTIRNAGEGPLVLRFTYNAPAFVPQLNACDMEQELLNADGSVADRNAGPCVFHPQHAHFHYQNMGTYLLYAVDGTGKPGAQPVSRSAKVGFCTIDVDNFTFGLDVPTRRPRTFSFPTCNIPNAYSTQLPQQVAPDAVHNLVEYMGISPGWGDIYTWDLPAQYIDISKVPDGVYEVVSRSNPDGGILTSSRALETGVTCIRITGTQVDVIREFPSQSNTAPLPMCSTLRSAGVSPAVAPAAGSAGHLPDTAR